MRIPTDDERLEKERFLIGEKILGKRISAIEWIEDSNVRLWFTEKGYVEFEGGGSSNLAPLYIEVEDDKK